MARSHVRKSFAGLAIVAGVIAAEGPARADRITLRGGGEIKGVVLKDASQPKTVLVQTESSAKPLSFTKDQVVAVVREPGPLDEYVANRDSIEATAQAQYDFGLWCEEQKL